MGKKRGTYKMSSNPRNQRKDKGGEHTTDKKTKEAKEVAEGRAALRRLMFAPAAQLASARASAGRAEVSAAVMQRKVEDTAVLGIAATCVAEHTAKAGCVHFHEGGDQDV